MMHLFDIDKSVRHDTSGSAAAAYSAKEQRGFVMVGKTPVSFDPETVTVLRECLDDAWARLQPAQQAAMLKTTLAERILKCAAHGERDRERLIDAALEYDRTA
jgi:hypothetical protein